MPLLPAERCEKEASTEPPSHIVRLQTESPLWDKDKVAQVRRAAHAALDFVAPRNPAAENAALIVSILCTDEQRMHELNRRFRNKDTACDSLAFPAKAQDHHRFERKNNLLGDFLNGFLGDIALGYQGLQRTVERHRLDAHAHCAHMTIHGVLHLTGFIHDSAEELSAMEAAEGTILERLGFADLHPLALP